MVSFENLLGAVGQSSIILAGYYISSRFLLKRLNLPVLIKDLTENIGSFALAVMILYEILHLTFFIGQTLYVVFSGNFIISVLFYIGFFIVVACLIYLMPFINKSFQNGVINLMGWENIAFILLYMLITIPTTSFTNWGDWIKSVTTLGQSGLSLPPISILVTIYATAACVLFFLSNKENSETQNISNPQSAPPPLQSQTPLPNQPANPINPTK